MPKEYIDKNAIRAAAIKEHIELQKNSLDSEAEAVHNFYLRISHIPAADVVQVVHARWIETPKDGWTRMECSGCGHSYYVPANINPIEWADDRNYCVKCGSRMDGGEHHAE